MYEDVYIVGKNPASFRVGEPAKRLCYKLRWSDGTEDFTAVSKLLSFKDIISKDL